MRKKTRILPLLLILILAFSLTAQAAMPPHITPLWNSTASCPAPTLSFSGEKAVCLASVQAYSGAEIEGTLTLFHGTTEVDSWPISGTTSAKVSGSCDVESGESYMLHLYVVVDGPGGIDKITKTTTGTCP